MKKNERLNVRRISNILFSVAGGALAVGLAIILLTYGPLILQELQYTLRELFNSPSTKQTFISKEIIPIDKQFGIVIPKLGANAHVVANIDPYDAKAYEYALTKGVAQARGTSVPGAMGNIFLFAHSSENFYVALQYNSVFYLLPKLVKGDSIFLYYNGVKFTYVVTDKKFVNPKEVSYLKGDQTGQTLTLMTCWPPGTNIQRLLVFATLSSK